MLIGIVHQGDRHDDVLDTIAVEVPRCTEHRLGTEDRGCQHGRRQRQLDGRIRRKGTARRAAELNPHKAGLQEIRGTQRTLELQLILRRSPIIADRRHEIRAGDVHRIRIADVAQRDHRRPVAGIGGSDRTRRSIGRDVNDVDVSRIDLDRVGPRIKIGCARKPFTALNVQQVLGRHAGESLDRLDRQGIVRIRQHRGKQRRHQARWLPGQPGRRQLLDREHRIRQQGVAGQGELAAGGLGIDQVPVLMIARVEIEQLGRGQRDRCRERRRVVPRRHASSCHPFRPVRFDGCLARDHVVSGAAGDVVPARSALKEVIPGSAIQDIVAGAAEQAVVPVAAANDQVGIRPLRPVFRIDTPLAPPDQILRIGMDFVVAGPRIEHGLLGVEGRVEGVVLPVRRGIRVVEDELLTSEIPDTAGHFVAVQERVPADRHVVRHRQTVPVQITAQVEDLIMAVAAIEPIAERRDIGFLTGCSHSSLSRLRRRQPVGQDLVDVVPAAAPQQVARLAIEAAGQHVIPWPADDPILTCPALQDVVPWAAQQNVFARPVP